MRLPKYIVFFLLGALLYSQVIWALPEQSANSQNNLPLVVIAADKIDSLELFATEQPSIKKLLHTSAIGLMNIRSGSGYLNTESGYLSLGTGSRSTFPGELGGTFEIFQNLTWGKAGSYLEWSLGKIPYNNNEQNLVVPEIGLILNQARTEDRLVIPGRLGMLFHKHGWKTCLLGNIDNPELKERPGGLLLMDQYGLVDEGIINNSLTELDPDFPYLYRTNISKTLSQLGTRLAYKKIILIEFGDFARLDQYRDEIPGERFINLKQAAWNHLNQLLKGVIDLQEANGFTLIVASPSVSKEGYLKKNLLTPLILSGPSIPPGILYSGTTKWDGIVANIDLLPTITSIAGFPTSNLFTGKIIKVITNSISLDNLIRLNEKLVAINANQRSILDWYMGLISFGWIAGLIFIYFKKYSLSDWLLTGVLVIPLVLITLPLLPSFLWAIPGFLILTLVLTFVFTRYKTISNRILCLSALIWSLLIIDQMSGWHLIRFSALGYSAMAGSRYYGLGNEFLGVFLAASLLLVHLIYRQTSQKWPAPLILGFSIFILSWPQFGAKFGGILAGTIGFSFYLFLLYGWRLNNPKLWYSVIGCGLTLLAIGWWDSLRPPSAQTHIGRFLHLLFSKNFILVGQIIGRKLAMNLKLTIFSPWVRIILLGFLLGVINRIKTKQKMLTPENELVWKAILISGIAAYLINDAGVLAFATCLAYGFTYVLLSITTHSR